MVDIISDLVCMITRDMKMNNVNYVPGQQIKEFVIKRIKTGIDQKGKPKRDSKEYEPIGIISGTIAQASQKDVERWKKIDHPITHTVVIEGTTEAKAEDFLLLEDDRKLFIQGKDDPGELGFFNILYCEERLDR